MIGVMPDIGVEKINDKRVTSRIRFAAPPRRNEWTSSAKQGIP
jgi:hypothetical protein